MQKIIATYLGVIVIATTLASSGTASNFPNWVSPVNTSASACYRKAYLSSDSCAQGYKSDSIATCWAQCPLDFPVECGMECIPRTSDCTSQILDKVLSVATVVLNTATAGMFGKIRKASEAIQLGVKCGQQLYSATGALVSYIEEVQANATLGQHLMSVVNQSDIVTSELPAAVSTCLDLPVSPDTPVIATAVNYILTAVVDNGTSILNPSSFLALMSGLGIDKSVQGLDANSQIQVQDILSAGTTCGTQLQALIHKVTQFVVAMKQKDPAVAVSKIRQALSVSELFLTGVPDAINSCSRNLTDDVYRTRDNLRSVMSTIVDGLVDSAVDGNGKTLSSTDYLTAVAGMGMDVIAVLDPTGIAAMVDTFLQPICAPTVFIGEIDDGSLTDALALTTEGQAFNGSYGTWSKSGDGTVNIVLHSLDSEDVTVVMHSGGDTVAKVKVASGATVSWNSTVTALQDQTLYLDRWRPGPFRVPSSRGGSLLMWVPRSSAGGKIDLHVTINGGNVDDVRSNIGNSSDPDVVQSSKGDIGKNGSTPLVPTAQLVDGQRNANSSTPTSRKTGVPHKLKHESVEPTTPLTTVETTEVPMPQLLVTLLRASNLPIGDTYIQGSASDPFVTFQLDDEYLRSSCVSGTLDPVWQPAETFEFEVLHTSQSSSERHLVIQVVDNDRFKTDDLLGEVRLPLSLFDQRPNEAVVETYELQVPDALKQASTSQLVDKKTSIQLDICFAQEMDGQKTLCVWENEDYVDGQWIPSHNNERRQWSTLDLQISSDNFDHVAPKVPEGLEGAGWTYSTKKGDDHGWVYATTYTGPWASAPSTLCYARRRLWQNNCRPAIACE